MSSAEPETRRPTPTRSRGWVWYFVCLAAMGAFAIVTPIVYNLSLQLKPEELAEARARWRQNGPADYDLQYKEKLTHDGQTDESEWKVKVRKGKVAEVVCDGENLSPAEYPDVAIDGKFAQIEKELVEDVGGGQRRNYATAAFDSRDGHPTRYIRRVKGSGERLEWNINLLPPTETSDRADGR
jgi:hypothetical protein